MTYDKFNKFCASLPATTHVSQWGDSDVWKVGGKVFAIGGWGPSDEPAFIFKTSDINYVFLCESDGYRPAPYFATRGMKWVQQIDNSKEEELWYYLTESHRLVSLGLTKKKQRELDLNQKE
jgi:predicted DNA-binding protein (MmcQ/YjbR family)